MELLGKYKNGNYDVKIYDDGTKIRYNELDNLTPDFPESIDMKITNYCEYNCPMCHEKSSIKGKHALLDKECFKFLKTLHPYTELAIGGGDPLMFPNLTNFLCYLSGELKLIPNITIKQESFLEYKEDIDYMIKNKALYGLGISVSHYDEKFVEKIKDYDNIVLHVIAGYTPFDEIMKFANKGLKILILGYKQCGRGIDFYNEEIEKEITKLDYNLSSVLNSFKVVSFDNLALTQLDVRRFLSNEEWDQFYMGDDGNHTMYIDLVEKKFAKNSTSQIRYELLDNVEDIFNVVRNESKN